MALYGRERLGPFWGFLAGWGFVVGKTAARPWPALMSPEIYRLLVIGWKPERYERWLTEILIDQLLSPTSASRRGAEPRQ